MKTTDDRPWWRMRRILLPFVTFALLLVALVIAVVRSGQSQIVIYNESHSALGPLTVSACGQRSVFSRLDDDTSVRVRLDDSGGASGVELSLPGGWTWAEGYIEPRGGYLVFIHIRPQMEVEMHTQISLWQRLLFGREGAAD